MRKMALKFTHSSPWYFTLNISDSTNNSCCVNIIQAIVDNLDEFRKFVNSDAEVKFVPHGEKLASFEAELVSLLVFYMTVALVVRAIEMIL